LRTACQFPSGAAAKAPPECDEVATAALGGTRPHRDCGDSDLIGTISTALLGLAGDRLEPAKLALTHLLAKRNRSSPQLLRGSRN
jgi:hypothetical protein